MPCRRPPTASSQGTRQRGAPPKDGEGAAQELLPKEVEVRIGKPGVEQRGERVAGHPIIAQHPRGDHGQARSQQEGQRLHPAPEQQRGRGREHQHDDPGKLDGIAETRGYAGREQIAAVALLPPGQQQVESGEAVESQRGIVVRGGSGHPYHWSAEVKPGGGERHGIGQAQAPADVPHQGNRGRQQAEVHQFGRRVLAESKRKYVKHLGALREHFVKAHAWGESPEPQVFGHQAEVIHNAIRLDFGRHRVNQIEQAIGGEENQQRGRGAGEGGRGFDMLTEAEERCSPENGEREGRGDACNQGEEDQEAEERRSGGQADGPGQG